MLTRPTPGAMYRATRQVRVDNGVPTRAVMIDTRCPVPSFDGYPCMANLWSDGVCSDAHDHAV